MNNSTRLPLRVSAMCFGIALGALAILSVGGMAHTVRAQNPAAEKVIFNFTATTGYYPRGVVSDPSGNLYVATTAGGIYDYGNILKLDPPGEATVLYTFVPGLRNYNPSPAGLTRDRNGNVYGTTYEGGTKSCSPRVGCGSVFKLTPSGAEGTLYSFAGGNDGYEPASGVTIDSAGNLYGTTIYGGGTGYCGGLGCGVLYKVTPSGSETILYGFTGGADGAYPKATPILDSAGNLYGTALGGGDLSCSPDPGVGCGTVWKLDTSGNLTVLYSFTGGTDGWGPAGGLVMDSSGNLYGTAVSGGDLPCAEYGAAGCGVVFEINSSGNFTVLYAFGSGEPNDGEYPESALLRDSAGNLYGTTVGGGDQGCSLYGDVSCGIVFKLSSSGNETILHAFTGGTSDGINPVGALITDGKNNLYGATAAGGSGSGGVIFQVQTQ